MELQDTQGPPVRAQSTAWQPRSPQTYKTLKPGLENPKLDTGRHGRGRRRTPGTETGGERGEEVTTHSLLT